MFWLWKSGGISLQPQAQAEQVVEECGATVAGSTAMNARLAPAIAEAFLRQSGYTVEPARTAANGEKRIVGARGSLRCTISIRGDTSSEGFKDLMGRKALVA